MNPNHKHSNYRLNLNQKNFPSLSVSSAPTSTAQPQQPQPSMATKSGTNSNFLGPSSQYALPPDSFGSSSSSSLSTYPAFSSASTSPTSSTSFAVPVVLPSATSSPGQEKNIQQGVKLAEKLMNEISEFLLDPSTEKFTTTSQLVKDCIENDGFKQIATDSQDIPTIKTLAINIIKFFDEAAKSSSVLPESQPVPLADIAKASYGLEACVKWDKHQQVFENNDWKILRPAVCSLMRKMMNKIHSDDLYVLATRGNVGHLLALLAWINLGTNYRVPDFGKQANPKDGSENINLLYGFSKNNGYPSLIEFTNRIINGLLGASQAFFDTRQFCKMVMQLGRMINDGNLLLTESEKTPQVNPTKLADQLVRISNSLLLKQYREFDHNQSPDYVNPVAVTNLCSGLYIFFLKGILDWENENHLKIAVKTASFIKKASTQPKADKHFIHECRVFLKQALNNVPQDSSQSFNEALNALNELKQRLSLSPGQQ